MGWQFLGCIALFCAVAGCAQSTDQGSAAGGFAEAKGEDGSSGVTWQDGGYSADLNCQRLQCECHADCDCDPSNGCESDPQSDDKNCGECGHRCKEAEFCEAGVCVPYAWIPG